LTSANSAATKKPFRAMNIAAMVIPSTDPVYHAWPGHFLGAVIPRGISSRGSTAAKPDAAEARRR
jgi:hypothetical protein